MKEQKKEFKTNGGITLIALVITIIVLLILAGVSISMLTGKNSILNKAGEVKEINEVASEKEILSIAVLAEKSENLNDAITASNLEEEIENQGKNTRIYESTDVLVVKFIDSGNIYEVDNNGNVTSSTSKIRDYQQTVISSVQQVIFENTITEDDILGTAGSFDAYEIKGISLEENGEILESVEGKSGTLSISGNFEDSTFEYTLTDFMKGDESFYIVIDVDGTNYYQKLSVIQGDCVRYEEDFVGIIYQTNYATWADDEDENYSNGKARIIDTTDGDLQFKFTFTGTGLDIITRTPRTSYVNCYEKITLTTSDGTTVFQIFDDNQLMSEEENYNVSMFNESGYSDYLPELTADEYTMRFYIYLAGGARGTGKFCLDAVEVYR